MTNADLKTLRDAIDEVDEQLITLLAKRFFHTEQVGRLKHVSNVNLLILSENLSSDIGMRLWPNSTGWTMCWSSRYFAQSSRKSCAITERSPDIDDRSKTPLYVAGITHYRQAQHSGEHKPDAMESIPWMRL